MELSVVLDLFPLKHAVESALDGKYADVYNPSPDTRHAQRKAE